eukprot:768563-Hanusia_phi.AAC.8
MFVIHVSHLRGFSIQGGYSVANAYWYWIQGVEAVHHNELEMIKAEMLQLASLNAGVSVF